MNTVIHPKNSNNIKQFDESNKMTNTESHRRRSLSASDHVHSFSPNPHLPEINVSPPPVMTNNTVRRRSCSHDECQFQIQVGDNNNEEPFFSKSLPNLPLPLLNNRKVMNSTFQYQRPRSRSCSIDHFHLASSSIHNRPSFSPRSSRRHYLQQMLWNKNDIPNISSHNHSTNNCYTLYKSMKQRFAYVSSFIIIASFTLFTSQLDPHYHQHMTSSLLTDYYNYSERVVDGFDSGLGIRFHNHKNDLTTTLKQNPQDFTSSKVTTTTTASSNPINSKRMPTLLHARTYRSPIILFDATEMESTSLNDGNHLVDSSSTSYASKPNQDQDITTLDPVHNNIHKPFTLTDDDIRKHTLHGSIPHEDTPNTFQNYINTTLLAFKNPDSSIYANIFSLLTLASFITILVILLESILSSTRECFHSSSSFGLYYKKNSQNSNRKNHDDDDDDNYSEKKMTIPPYVAYSANKERFQQGYNDVTVTQSW